MRAHARSLNRPDDGLTRAFIVCRSLRACTPKIVRPDLLTASLSVTLTLGAKFSVFHPITVGN